MTMSMENNNRFSLLFILAAVHFIIIASSVCCISAFVVQIPSSHNTKQQKSFNHFFVSRRKVSEQDEQQTTTEDSNVVIELNDNDDNDVDNDAVSDVDDELLNDDNVEVFTFELVDHRPLGCTVEESLANEKYVFVSKVVEDSNSAKSGIQVGDVIIGVSSLLGIENSIGIGVAKVKSLVVGTPDDETLVLRVARGTNVMDDHEKSLVELCSGTGTDDAEIDNCVLDYLVSEYEECDIDDDSCIEGKEDEENVVNEVDLIDNLYNMWDDDLGSTIEKPKAAEEKETEQESNVPKVKPWSSRSSPSGTWVRNPETGKMENIDA